MGEGAHNTTRYAIKQKNIINIWRPFFRCDVSLPVEDCLEYLTIKPEQESSDIEKELKEEPETTSQKRWDVKIWRKKYFVIKIKKAFVFI